METNPPPEKEYIDSKQPDWVDDTDADKAMMEVLGEHEKETDKDYSPALLQPANVLSSNIRPTPPSENLTIKNMVQPMTGRNEPPAQVKKIELLGQQVEAVDKIAAWFGNSPNLSFRLGGFAGTGKTTILRVLRDKIHCEPIFCAFTGKAAHVMRRKGLPASTIHQLIYNIREEKGEVVFELKHPSELEGDLIVVDEASMISRELLDHLMTFGKPILFVGDPGQLEPIGNDPYLMKDPDYVLTEIRRQGVDSPIIDLATAIRLTGNLPIKGTKLNSPDGKSGYLVTSQHSIPETALKQADQIIVGRNQTRIEVNTRFRRLFTGRSMSHPPHKEDKIICLKNNTRQNVFNGMIATIDNVEPNHYAENSILVDITTDTGEKKYKLPVWLDQFQPNPLQAPKDCPYKLTCWTYGWAITCHKSQGSEWDAVIVYDCYIPKWDMDRWRYTAVTRASKQLFIGTQR